MLVDVNYVRDAEHDIPSVGIEGQVDAGVLTLLGTDPVAQGLPVRAWGFSGQGRGE